MYDTYEITPSAHCSTVYVLTNHCMYIRYVHWYVVCVNYKLLKQLYRLYSIVSLH